MKGGVRTPPNGSLRLGGLSRDYSVRFERSPETASTESLFSRIVVPKHQATDYFEGSPGG